MYSRPKIIGICLSTIHCEDRFHFIKALNDHAVENGWRLMIFNACSDLYEAANPNNGGEREVFRLIPYDLLDAMIVFPHFIYDEKLVRRIIDESNSHNIPTISIDKKLEGCMCFSFSYSDTFERLCDHVICTHGARNVFMMAGTEGNDFSEERIAAFRRVLEQNGIPFNKDNIGYGNYWSDPTLAVLKRWFEKEKRSIPDAVICANDSMAITVSSYLQSRGYHIPEDCIITGFDGIVQAGYHFPNLTTCRQNYEEMAVKLLEAVEAARSGNAPEGENVVDFRIIRSQSCGCKPVEFHNVNGIVQTIFDRLRLCQERQELMCNVQSSIAKMKSVSELPQILVDKFVFHSTVFAVNDDIFKEPEFGLFHTGGRAFSENVNVIKHRYFWNDHEPCTIPITRLIPDLDDMLCRTDPMIVCCVHSLDLVLGYSVFQPEITFDEYEKINVFMSAVNSALGIYHSKMQIEYINAQLTSVNDELENLYVHDHMTGLLNRRGFYRQLNSRVASLGGKDAQLVLVSADLDGLKTINDNYGHLEGDNAIITVGNALRESALLGEICARFGGDEFTVAGIIDCGGEEGYFEGFKKRVYDYLERYDSTSGKPYSVGASLGFYTAKLSGEMDFDSFMKIADDRMYADKAARKKQRLK